MLDPRTISRRTFMRRMLGAGVGLSLEILGQKLELGPAPRGMDRFPVRIDGEGVVIVDTRELIEGPPKNAVTFRDVHPPDVGCL